MANDMFSTVGGAAAPFGGGVAASAERKAAPAGGFAAVLAQTEAHASGGLGGQGIADGQTLATDGSATWVPGQWAAVTVSPALRVITDGPMDVAPDALLAFAQQQGLSPEAIQALRLQMQAVPGSSATGPMASAMSPGAEVLQAEAVSGWTTAMGSAAGALVARGVNVVSAAPGGMAPGEASQIAGAADQSAEGGLMPGFRAAQGGGLFAADVGVSREALVVGQVGVAQRGANIAGMPSTAITGTSMRMSSATGSLAGRPLGGESGIAVLAPLTPRMTDGVSLVPQASASASQGAVTAASIDGIAPGWLGLPDKPLISARGAAGTAVPPADAGIEVAAQLGVAILPMKTVFKAASQAPAGAPTGELPASSGGEALVLDGVSEQDVGDLLQVPSLSRHAHAAPSNAPAPLGVASMTPGADGASGASDLQARYEAVSQKLGEAVAQRMQAQIQRGDWQVQLHLRPKELGFIDVQLGMRGGDLVASFQASHALTRDMLQDQLPRLRDMLSSAGIDVASADVGSQSGGRSGGNPTPSQREATGVPGDTGRAASPVAPAPLVSARTVGGQGNDGLDLWA